MKEIPDQIEKSFRHLVNHQQFQDWFSRESFTDGDLLVANNSFVFHNVKTNKSDSFLIAKWESSGIGLQNMGVCKGMHFKQADFRHYSLRQANKPEIQPLEIAIEEQLDNIGRIVFALIGYIDDDLIVNASFSRSVFERMIWDPGSTEPLVVKGRDIIVNDPYSEDLIWNCFADYCNQQNIAVTAGLKNEFGKVVDELAGKAIASLKLPADGVLRAGITDLVVEELKSQRNEYCAAFDRCRGEPDHDAEAFNQILRIAYNFAGDAITFLRLIVSVCDLKPIVLWATIGEHYALSEAFRSLPWTRAKNRFQLEDYKRIIGDARNSAFHNLFQFRKSLQFILPDMAIKKPELIFFSEYTKKGNNQLLFQDKELVDVFLEFTRARHRVIPARFWEKNIEVMDRSLELFSATSKFLRNLYLLMA